MCKLAPQTNLPATHPFQARPTVSVYNTAGVETGSVALPSVLLAPIRSDVVQFVHSSASRGLNCP